MHPVVPDCRKMVLADRVALLDELTRGRTDVVLVGSSYGGLAALALADRHPERFAGLLLLAPALHHTEPPVADASQLMVAPDLPCVIIHGRADSIVPIAVSRSLAQRCGHVELLETDDTHVLESSLDLMLQQTRRLLP